MKKYLILIALVFALPISAFAATTVGNGRKTVTSAGTAEALSATATDFSEISICAETDNTGVIAVGGSGVIASLSTRTGVPLNAGDCYTLGREQSRTMQLTVIYIDSTVSGDGVTFNYIKRV